MHTLCIALLLLVELSASRVDDEWRWSDDRAGIASYLLHNSQIYDVSLTRRAAGPDPWRIEVTITRYGKQAFQFACQIHGAFAISSHTLVFAEFHPMTTGCRLHSVNLQTGKTNWATYLQAVGPVAHSIYINRINLYLSDNSIVIYGNESAGKYIESIDLNSGQKISHKLVAEASDSSKSR